MSARSAALVGTLFFVVLLAVLTIDVMIETGIDALVVISLGIVGMVGIGVLNALLNRPEE